MRRAEGAGPIARVSRRTISFSLYGGAWLLLVATLPLVVIATALTDLLSGGRTAALRASLFLAWYLTCEVAGVLASAFLWSFAQPALVGRDRWLAAHYAVQLAWATALWRAAVLLFRLRVDVQGSEHNAPGPIVLLVRHVSVADTLIPSVFATGEAGVRLRYVLKRELLWAPSLDVVGNRLPNVFVERGSDDSAAQTEKVRALSRGLNDDEGILIFPEGTRFTQRKRSRVLARMEERGEARSLARAKRLRHVLPPRRGGVMAALAGDERADVVLCAHTGFEHISTFRELFLGSLVGRRVFVRFWRVPRSAVPAREEAIADWLDEQWGEVDEWIEKANAA
jgi:1-acyl-sn-glycerol-3-phosphate acyltransferase